MGKEHRVFPAWRKGRKDDRFPGEFPKKPKVTYNDNKVNKEEKIDGGNIS